MKDAVSVGMPSSIGHDFFEDMEARFVDIHRATSPTGIKELDDPQVFDGGLGRGELGVVVAPTGVGKSHWLVAMGAEAMRAGKTVVHYTLELSETLTGKRYDANLTNIPVNDLVVNKSKVAEYYENNDHGRLIIKEYAMRSASVVTIKNHLEKIKLRGYTPSLVLIDYADIMRSTKTYDSLRHELQLIYEELRQTAKEYNVPIWTASQSNREGSSQEYVGLHNMSEAYGKAMTADVVVTISRKPEEKATGAARIFVAKNRAGKDGLLFPVHVDTARSKFRVMSEDEVMELNPEKKLKKVWNELKEIKKDTLQ
jgi:replicative DNA helicase